MDEEGREERKWLLTEQRINTSTKGTAKMVETRGLEHKIFPFGNQMEESKERY